MCPRLARYSTQMTDKFFFHSKSAPATPGKGVNESLATSADYTTLKSNPHWRRALSNFWIGPFTLDGHRWNTVEHYFQAQKLYIAIGPERSLRDIPEKTFEESELFRLFCFDGLNPYSTASEDGSAAQKRRKWYYLTPHELMLWDSRKEEVMAKAQFAKFSQNPTLKAILLATGHAELWHGAARQPAARMFSLERVRAALREGKEDLGEE
jgi:hypothetical protein